MNKDIRTVRGFVRFADGHPARGVKVAAFDRDLRSERALGHTEAGKDGAYRIDYSGEQGCERERDTPDLVVKAFGAEGALLVASPIRFDAPRLVTIDLTIPKERRRPPPLFEKIGEAVRPALSGVTPGELEEDQEHQDLTYLAGGTGFDKAALARYVLSHRLAAQHLPAELWFALLGGSALRYDDARSLADNLKTASAALAALGEAAARRALAASIAKGDVHPASPAHVDAWIEAFLAWSARAGLGDADAPTFAGQALDHAKIGVAARREAFARLYAQHQAPTPALWDALGKEGSFSHAEVADLRTSYRLADLTQGDFSVVKALKDTFDLRRPEQLATLAKQSEGDWVQLIRSKSEARAIQIPIAFGQATPAQPSAAEVYGKALSRSFREAFPTAAFSGGLERAMKTGGPRGLRHGKALSAFLDAHAGFDLVHTRIDDFLSREVRAEFRGPAEDPSFRSEVMALQRVFKLAPTFEAADVLLADGVHSAQRIYRMGASAFVRRYSGRAGMSAAEAQAAWNRAAQTHAQALTIALDLKSLDPGTLPAAIPTSGDALSTFPDYENLFRAGDVCSCEDCRSVLSPAAYFADTLMFLRDRRAKNPASSVKDVLFARRPDLGYLELNCDNALTPLPYVDAVCEVLERVISGGASDVELAGLGAVPAAPALAKTAVANALSAAKLSAGADFTLSRVDPANPDLWVVHGDGATYLLKKKATPNFFAELLPNTKASAEELRAYPAYVDPAAYAALRQARFPGSLPFDLFGAEVRATFEKSGLSRWDLMRTLRGPAAPNNPSDGDIAAEYFGISSDPAAAFDEKRLLLAEDTTTAGQQAVWGETGNPGWLNTLANVKTFLRKTALGYEDLLALLDLRFINPASDISIQHLDASCDTDKKRLQGLTLEKLDRIHRFLRLWRKLDGWKPWEVDLVIRAPAIGAGRLDEAFLVNLHSFDQLKRRASSRATVSRVAALFGALDHDTHFTHAHEKREDGLYQSLFLNKKLVQPLDPAFEVARVSVAGPTAEKISGHRPAVLAALGVREADLDLLSGLIRAWDGQPYITDDLTLANLSFLWRHAWLAKLLALNTDEYATLLKLLGKDLQPVVDAATGQTFVDPRSALAFVESADQLKASGFSPDELNFILTADRSARSAVKEADAARFLMGLRTTLQAILKEYDPTRYQALNPPSDPDALATLLLSLLALLHRDEAGAQAFVDTLRDAVCLQAAAPGLPAGFDFPAAIKAAIPIRCGGAATLHFTGLMTNAQKNELLSDPSLVAVAGIASYQAAIEELFQRPRLLLKVFDPVFTAPLPSLPATVDFDTLADKALAQKVSYDPSLRALVLTGILSADDKAALDGLSAEPAYRQAVNSLFTQPALGAFPADQLWLQDTDLQLPLTNHLTDNLTTAITKALVYLGRTLSEAAVVQQMAAQLGLAEGLTRRLLSEYAVMPGQLTVLAHLTGPFAATSGVVDYATLPATFDGWFWANRAAALWRKWKLTLAEWESLRAIATQAKLLDFATLPLNAAAPIVRFDLFQRTSRLIRFKAALPETSAALLDVLADLAGGAYASAADFAADVALLNGVWSSADVQALTASLDLAYPGDYLLAESWERMRRAFYFTDNLNASVDTVKAFAAAAMALDHANTLKGLMRSKLGHDTWLGLSAEIQDALRERKRDALSAFLLARPQPPFAPTGKWENTNDLYAYYLLDVEMCSCTLTSRLVQASGSVQLFVQRCFMGVEPDVVVKDDGDDGDSAWRWWTWMRKYRVWEANRKVFLWPENWIEPELKKDRSSFFKDLERDILQNDVNQDTVRGAFAAYLEKLDGVAQLEVAGFYQEDEGDDTIVHVFGRTRGADPHLYYYRRFDYRQWTPWEKVDVDIQGDYLVPAVVGGRLFLFWPVFTEVPDEKGNHTVSTPDINQSNVPLQPAKKRLKLQMAVSDYRQGKWTPKRVSKDFDRSYSYDVEIVHKHYVFYPVDLSDVDGRFGVCYRGYSVDKDDNDLAYLSGSFEVSGCRGIPEISNLSTSFRPALWPTAESVGGDPTFLRWAELPDRKDAPANDLTLVSSVSASRRTEVLQQTPWRFQVSPPWHFSYLDRLLADGLLARSGTAGAANVSASYLASELRETPVGSWLPFFYNDKKRTFFVLPSTPVLEKGRPRRYYPDVKGLVKKLNDLFEGWVRTRVDAYDLGTLNPAKRAYVEQLLAAQFPGEIVPPFTDDQVKDLLVRHLMRFVHYYLGLRSLMIFQYRQFDFRSFYHPFVCDFLKLVYDPLQGVPALMTRETQLKDSGFSFEHVYQPTVWVVDRFDRTRYPAEVVDFTPDGAYSSYNWELFFHAPLLIANALSQNQRFEEARDWYHYIFNPMGAESAAAGGSPMSKYWITKPFFETTDPAYVQQRIDSILRMLAGDTTVTGYSGATKKALEDQVKDWRTNPFDPHRIASYRTVAYQKTVFMKYLDNLIAWGDFLFRQDSMESINEATQLYVLAAELLGPRPMKVPPQGKPPLESYAELEKKLDVSADALVELENLVPLQSGGGGSGQDTAPIPMLYFCIPQNDKLLAYWDTVADRLYKIRHCLNIEGVARRLALFEPPVDPGALVKAAAAGIDIGAALADLDAPLPLYRFGVLLAKANEITGEVKALGAALLAVLEKNDAECLSLLRQDQEIRLLEAVKGLRESQVEEAKESLENAKRAKELAQIKHTYYSSREFMNAGEAVAVELNKASTAIDAGIAIGYTLAGGLKLIPNFVLGAAGFGGSPEASAETGGKSFGDSAEDLVRTLESIAKGLDKAAALSGTVASYQRRRDDWNFQNDLATKEMEQIDRQIAAAELRIAIAQKELDNQALQIENARATNDFMRSKYTNQDLYRWQIGQISGAYFQSYKLAVDLAKRAERCFRFELGLAASSFISFGYWDNLKKGLLAGEALQYDLRRMEAAHLAQNRRELELVKHVSLKLLDPLALVKLRETGRCFFELPEELFDLDYPGHYFRRIKSVSLTLPCVAGPYTTISATLRLLKNSIRTNTKNGDDGYPRNTDEQGLLADDARFVETNVPVKSIAASGGQNDSGLFELSFRDERYLPFEGAGAISVWSLELFNDLASNNPDPANPDFGRPLRQFDYGSITDAVLHIKYTAREDAGPFRSAAIKHLRDHFAPQGAGTPSLLLLDLRRDFPTPWSRFQRPTKPADGNVLELDISADTFPLRDAGKTLQINTIWLLARCTGAAAYTVTLTPPLSAPAPAGASTMSLSASGAYGGLHFGQKDVSAAGVTVVPTAPPVTWKLKVTPPHAGNLTVDPVEMGDLLLVLGYDWT
ncbi:neuraminidase-like domain-containing protein [Sorangium sp. So ce1153]|uniref:Tc toxin subunit A-related protein n=1 Tax=Sorangium sp. So ce1153 TaxID=3133333 RepID=UPI003F62C4A2